MERGLYKLDLINIKDLSFGYNGNIDIIKNINIEIQKGEFVCIIGENGSGKSTLIKCILGLNKNYKGKIEVNERMRIFTANNRNTK